MPMARSSALSRSTFRNNHASIFFMIVGRPVPLRPTHGSARGGVGYPATSAASRNLKKLKPAAPIAPDAGIEANGPPLKMSQGLKFGLWAPHLGLPTTSVVGFGRYFSVKTPRLWAIRGKL